MKPCCSQKMAVVCGCFICFMAHFTNEPLYQSHFEQVMSQMAVSCKQSCDLQFQLSHGSSIVLSEEHQRNLSHPCPGRDVRILNAVCSSSLLQHSFRSVQVLLSCLTMVRSSFYLCISNLSTTTSFALCYVQLVSLETVGNPTHLIYVKCSDHNFTVRWNATLIASSYILCYTYLNGIFFSLEYCNGLLKTEAN